MLKSLKTLATVNYADLTIKSLKEELLEAEVAKLREQLKKANMEKSRLSSEYEKLSIIFRSQRQQLHGIKLALASSTPPKKSDPLTHPSSGIQQQVISRSSYCKSLLCAKS